MKNFIEYFIFAFPKLLDGTLITLKISFVSISIGLLLGIPLAFVRVYGGKISSKLTMVYSDILRGTPILVQLFLIYYGLPQFGIVLSPMLSAYLALGLNSAAYQIEYFRGAIISVSERQMLAARGIGMTNIQAIHKILIPQVFRLVLPSWANEVISMIKNTSVVYLIAVPELMTQAKILISRYFNPIESYLAVAIFYLVIVVLLTSLFNFIERKVKIPGLELEEVRG